MNLFSENKISASQRNIKNGCCPIDFNHWALSIVFFKYTVKTCNLQKIIQFLSSGSNITKLIILKVVSELK